MRRICDAILTACGASDSLIGDLHELGARRSRGWYVRQTLAFAGRSFTDGAQRRPWRTAWIGVMAVTFLAGAIAEVRAITQPAVAETIRVEVEASGWRASIDREGRQRLVPAAALRVHRGGPIASGRIQLNAVFTRIADQVDWGSQWIPTVDAAANQASSLIEVVGEHGHVGIQPPEYMFEHELFRDARLVVFGRVGGAQWSKVAEIVLPRQVL